MKFEIDPLLFRLIVSLIGLLLVALSALNFKK